MGMQDSNSNEIKKIKTATESLASWDGPVTTDFGVGPVPTARATPSPSFIGMSIWILNTYVYIKIFIFEK